MVLIQSLVCDHFNIKYNNDIRILAKEIIISSFNCKSKLREIVTGTKD